MNSLGPKVYSVISQKTLLISAVAAMLVAACSTSTTTQANGADDGGDAGAGGSSDGGTSAGGSPTAEAGTRSANGGGVQAGSGGAPAGSGGTQAGSAGTTSTVAELTCSTYCAAVETNCLAETVKQYKSPESCMSSCAAFRLGTLNDRSGNTLGCRSHYAALAATDSATHCSSAGPSGGGRCGTNCDAYCALMATVCPSVFEDETLCRTDCQQMVGVGQTNYRAGGSGDNLQCRIYHVTFAAEGFPAVHCPHAAPVPLAPCAN